MKYTRRIDSADIQDSLLYTLWRCYCGYSIQSEAAIRSTYQHSKLTVNKSGTFYDIVEYATSDSGKRLTSYGNK